MATEHVRDRRLAFERIFKGLCLATREPINQAEAYAEQLRTYADALDDLPIAIVERAAQQIRRSGVERKDGRRWSGFPTTSEWHTVAETFVAAKLREVIALAREEPWHVDHDACDDTGWYPRVCVAGDRCGRVWCDRQAEDYTHTYREVCVCRATNRTYQRRLGQVTA